jgi:hypothetical protein
MLGLTRREESRVVILHTTNGPVQAVHGRGDLFSEFYEEVWNPALEKKRKVYDNDTLEGAGAWPSKI